MCQGRMGFTHRDPASSCWDFCSLSCLAVGSVVTVITCRPGVEGVGKGRGCSGPRLGVVAGRGHWQK